MFAQFFHDKEQSDELIGQQDKIERTIVNNMLYVLSCVVELLNGIFVA